VLEDNIMTDKLTFDDFHKSTFEAWKQVAVQSLKGGDFDKMLTTPTDEGITLQPLYTAQDIENLPYLNTLPAQFPYLRGTSNQPKAWKIAQSIDIQSPSAFNQALRHALENGQTAIVLRRNAPIINNQNDLNVALDGIDLKRYPVISMDNWALAKLLFKHDDHLHGIISGDAFASVDVFAQDSTSDDGEIVDKFFRLFDYTRYAIDNQCDVKTIAISTLSYHNNGATTTQEIAYALASGVVMIRALLTHGLTIDEIAPKMVFEIGIGGNFLLEISKFRALRMLWAQVVSAFGGHDESAKISVYAQTGLTNKSQFDAHTNILRTATEALSAVIGGVDGLEVLPFDAVSRPSDEFSRRVARNQQLILQHEVNLAKLIDPSGGSYAIEHLTDQIARKAWAHFQAIEAQGGMLSALETGTIQAEIEATRSARSARYAKRKEKLVGVNMYVNTSEAQPIVDETLDNKSYRYAQPFEQLRHAVLAYAQAHGHKPTLYLINIGALRRHKPRTDFTLGFFGIGGFDFINPVGKTSVTEIAQAIEANTPDAVVICGTDDDYLSIVPELVPSLKVQNPNRPIILAGYPKDQVDAYKQAGIDEFIYLGADCLALNNWLLRCFE
jgi:methylmalonyl-CoA mutase